MRIGIARIRSSEAYCEDLARRYLFAAEELLLKAKPEDGILVSELISCVCDTCMATEVLGQFDIDLLDLNTRRRWAFILHADKILRHGKYKMLPMLMCDYKDIIDKLINPCSRSEADSLPEQLSLSEADSLPDEL